MRYAAALLFVSLAPAQVFDIGAPQRDIVAGQQFGLSAAVRDAGGQPMNPTLVWESSDPSVISVDSSGNVAGLRLGTATIKVSAASIPFLFGQLELRVVPREIALTPSQADLFTGDSQQFTAQALDLNGQPLDAAFSFRIVGGNGFSVPVATISDSGLLQANGTGRIDVQAALVFPPREGKPNEISISAPVTIRLRSKYQFTRMLATDQTRTGVTLRPSPSALAGNDSGKLALTGSLDGISTGLLAYRAGHFQLLLSGGVPAPLPGGVVESFSSPSVNNAGQVLTRVGVAGSSGGLLLCADDGSCAYVLLEKSSYDLGSLAFSDLSFLSTTPYSLNDAGDIVFRGIYRRNGSDTYTTALFRLSAGGLDILWTSDQALPGLAAPVDFDSQQFGIDNQGTVYFLATAGLARVIFRLDATGKPVKLFALNDAFSSSTVSALNELVIARTGDIAFRFDRAAGGEYVGRVTSAGKFENFKMTTTPHVITASGGGVLLTGNAGSGNGLYRWRPGQTAMDALLKIGAAGPGGNALTAVDAAFIDSTGAATAMVRTVANDMIVVAAATPTTAIFQAGAALDVSANLQLRGLVRGAGAGKLNLLLGDPSSIASAGDAVTLRLGLGDPLSSGVTFAGAAGTLENAPGDIVFQSRGAIFRLSGSAKTRLLDSTVTDGTLRLFNPLPLAQNDKGQIVFVAGSSQNDARLYLYDGGKLTALARTGTASPGGGTIADFLEAAVDSGGRVLASFRISGGPSGLFIYENAKWRAAALIGTFNVGGQAVAALAQVRSAGGDFFAHASLRGTFVDAAVVRFDGQGWETLASTGDVLPNGATLGYIYRYDVNQLRQIAFVGTYFGGAKTLVVRSPDRGLAVVADNSDVFDNGSLIVDFGDLSLRNNGILYFTIFDVQDRYVVYSAQPL